MGTESVVNTANNVMNSSPVAEVTRPIVVGTEVFAYALRRTALPGRAAFSYPERSKQRSITRHADLFDDHLEASLGFVQGQTAKTFIDIPLEGNAKSHGIPSKEDSRYLSLSVFSEK